MLRVLLISLLLCVAVRASGFSVTLNATLPGVRWHGLVAAVSTDGTTGYGLSRDHTMNARSGAGYCAPTDLAIVR